MRDVLFSFYDFNMISLTTQCRVHLTIDAHIHTHTYTIRTHKYAHTCMHAHTLKLWNSPYDCPNSPSQDKQVICYHACPPQGGTHIDTHTCTQLVPYLHEAPQLPGTAQPRDTVYLFALRTGESTIAIDSNRSLVKIQAFMPYVMCKHNVFLLLWFTRSMQATPTHGLR